MSFAFNGSNGSDTVIAFVDDEIRCEQCLFPNPTSSIVLTRGSYPLHSTLVIDGINAFTGFGDSYSWGAVTLSDGTGDAMIGTGIFGPAQIDASLIGYLNIEDVQISYFQGQLMYEQVDYIINPAQLTLPEAGTAPLFLLGLAAFVARFKKGLLYQSLKASAGCLLDSMAARCQ